MKYAFFTALGEILFIYTGPSIDIQAAANSTLDYVLVDHTVAADTHWIPDVEDPDAAALSAKPSPKHVFNYVTRAWELPSGAKQLAADEKIRQLQDTIYSMQREPVTAFRSDSLTLTSLYFATDHFRSMLANPERIGVDSMGGVRFWGADGFEHTVGIGWFDNFNPLVQIYQRDKLLDIQLYNARAAVLALVADTGATVSDIVDYDPGFTLPSYPYA